LAKNALRSKKNSFSESKSPLFRHLGIKLLFFVFPHSRPAQIIDQIYQVIKDLFKEGEKRIPLNLVHERCTNKGFTRDQVEDCLKEYEGINVWAISGQRLLLM
jgi:hypothetical protein